MASRFLLVVFLVSSVHGMDWSEMFTHWQPFRPHICPTLDLGSNEHYTMVRTNGTQCSSSLQNRCHHHHRDNKDKRSRFYMTTTYRGPCSALNTTTCTNYECKRSCVAGYHRNSDGRCVNTVTLHCFNGGVPNHNMTECVCPANFTGGQCDIPICSPGCKNGGVCSLPPNSRCYCPNYLTGGICETPVCGYGCRNGGECVLTGTTTRCVCRPGYVGDNCEFDMPVCDASDMIENITRCMSDDDCYGGRYCCRMYSKSIWGHCSGSVLENYVNVTCMHPDGAMVATTDIYNSVRDCQTCVCYPPTNTSSEHGDIQCTSAGCSGDFLSNSKCCPNTTDNRPCPAPVIRGCPRKGKIIYVYTAENDNSALLVNTFQAHDCLGGRLHVDLNRVYFSACACDTLNVYNVRATSDRDFNHNQGTCDFRVMVRDSTSPVFITCPAGIYVRQEETVSWAKPIVTDNVGIRHLYLESSKIKNNSMDVSPGIYFLRYTAIDWQDNTAFCSFRVNVYKSDTDNVPPELRSRKTEVSPVIIAGSVVGVLCITLLALVVAMVRVCRIRNNRLRGLQQRQHVQQQSGTPTDIYSIYTSDPPPYEVAAKHKLPEYSVSDNPPTYDDVTKEAYNNPSYTPTEEVAGSSGDMRSERRATGSKRVTSV